MKPIKYWLNRLPEPYRTQALEVCYHERLDELAKSAHDAIFEMCIWDITPEGFDHWYDIHNKLLSGTIQLRPLRPLRHRPAVRYGGVPKVKERRKKMQMDVMAKSEMAGSDTFDPYND